MKALTKTYSNHENYIATISLLSRIPEPLPCGTPFKIVFFCEPKNYRVVLYSPTKTRQYHQ